MPSIRRIEKRYTWTHFLRSKDETPEVLIDFLRLVQRGLQAQVRVVRTDKGTEFLNQTLHAYFAAEGIQPQTYIADVAASFQRSQIHIIKLSNVKSLFGEIDGPKKSQVKLKDQIKMIHVQGDLITLKCHIKAQNQESQSMNN
nr:retrovirus-related Pol polyprotein from transposon TNT 1-94 [Tanacetum cinerariifolium]